MKREIPMLGGPMTAVVALSVLALSGTNATAKEPCGDHGECKALVEINSSDGDIGFHFLMDGGELIGAKVKRPDRKTIFSIEARRDLRQQTFTETFVESAEPLCFDPLTDQDPENDEEDFVTLEDFLARWSAGRYKFVGTTEDGGAFGATRLEYDLPAAPTNVNFDAQSGVISWEAGNDLGACATSAELDDLVTAGDLPVHPQDVPVAIWEAVLEPDVEDGDPLGALKLTIRLPGDIAMLQVDVPDAYLASLPDDTPGKIEVGAIGTGDNATFTELEDLCLNENQGCE